MVDRSVSAHDTYHYLPKGGETMQNGKAWYGHKVRKQKGLTKKLIVFSGISGFSENNRFWQENDDKHKNIEGNA